MKRKLCQSIASVSQQTQWLVQPLHLSRRHYRGDGKRLHPKRPSTRHRSDAKGNANEAIDPVRRVSSEDGARNSYLRLDNSTLPLPPFLDPAIESRQRRHQERKVPSRPEAPTPFQQSLLDNPYAQALSTPLRLDALSQVLTPRHFLQTFHTDFHAPPPQPIPRRTSWFGFPLPGYADTDPPPKQRKQKLIAHLVPTPDGGRPRPENGGVRNPRSYALLNAEALGEFEGKREKMLVDMRHEKLYGRERKDWKFDEVEVLERTRSGVEEAVVAGVTWADRLGLLGRVDADGEVERVEGQTRRAAVLLLRSPIGGHASIEGRVRSAGWDLARREEMFSLYALLGEYPLQRIREAASLSFKGQSRVNRGGEPRTDDQQEILPAESSETSQVIGPEALILPVEKRTMRVVLAVMRLEMYRKGLTNGGVERNGDGKPGDVGMLSSNRKT